MKNSLKKVNLLLIALMVLFSGLKSVYATREERIGADNQKVIADSESTKGVTYTTKAKISSASRSSYYKFGLSWTGTDGKSYSNNNISYATYYDNYRIKKTSFYLYCLDPANWSESGLYAKRFLLSPSNSLGVNSYDTALMYILTSNESYAAKSIAIRSISALWGYEYGNDDLATDIGKNSYRLYAAYFGQALKWLEKEGISSSYNRLLNAGVGLKSIDSLKSGSLEVNNVTYSYKLYGFSDYSGGNTVSKAEELFKGALSKAADYAEANKNGFANVGENKTLAPVKTPEVVTSDTEMISYRKTYDFTLNKFTNDGKAFFSIDSLKFDKGAAAVGARFEPYVIAVSVNDNVIYDRAKNIGTLNYKDNILAYQSVKDLNIDVSKDVKISVTIEILAYYNVSGNENHISCATQPMDYTLAYSYNDSSIPNSYSNYLGIVWQGKKISSSGKPVISQRFISVEKLNDENSNDGKKTVEMKDSVSLIECGSCSTLASLCEKTGNRFSAECTKLKEANCGCTYLNTFCSLGDNDACNKYEKECASSCETTVSNEFQCCDEANDILLISQENKKDIEINGPSNTVACFVNKIDEIKNNKNDNTGYTGVSVEDEAHNSYTMLSNKYCAVSCKEDYAMNLPSSKLVNAGRYFTFRMGIEGKKTCYTSTIDKSSYNTDIKNAQIELINAYNDYVIYKAAQDKANANGITSSTLDCASGCGTRTGYSLSISILGFEPVVNNDGTVSRTTKQLNKTFSSNGTTGSSHYSCTTAANGKQSCEWVCDSSCKDGSSSEIKTEVSQGLEKAKTRLANAKKSYESIISDFNSCTNFTTDINFDPEVTYDYQEFYNSKAVMEEYNKKTGTTYQGENYDEEWYCDGTVSGSKYNCSISPYKTQTGHLVTRVYTVCTEAGCSNDTKYISTANYAKKTETVSASYRPTTLYYNRYPNGTISTNESDNNDVALENRLPVSLNTKRGIYEYNINITDLGEFYKEESLGRLAGSSNRAVLAQKKFNDLTNYINNSINYNCSYLVNMGKIDEGMLKCDFGSCKDGLCDFECVGPGCGQYCDNGHCDYNCIGAGCIYNEGDGTSLFEKQVSLNNLFPNGTDSYNWNEEKNSKADQTIEMIEGKANTIYDEKPILSITITPTTAKAIKKYNKDNKNVYTNDTLTCKDINKHENIACYSNVLSQLIEGTFNGIDKNAINYVDEARNPENTNSGYFTTWSSVSENNMLGPSWKIGKEQK